MLLLVEKSPLRKAIRNLLSERGYDHALGNPNTEHLFDKALGCETIIYAPTSSMLFGSLAPEPTPARMRAVVGAANAPGCKSIVVVVPKSGDYEPELDVLRRDGKPYVIVRAPPLVEEVGAELANGDHDSLWIAKGGNVEAAHAKEVAEVVLAAVHSQYHGRVEDVQGAHMDMATLFREAAHVGGSQVRVHSVWPPLHRIVRPVARWFNGGEPAALTLAVTLENRALGSISV